MMFLVNNVKGMSGLLYTAKSGRRVAKIFLSKQLDYLKCMRVLINFPVIY